MSYGQAVTVLTSWHAGRGDTSGTPTKEPDVIIEGAGFRWTVIGQSVIILSCDWFRIGCGNSNYKGSKNATISLVLLEHDWYHLPGGGPVTKHQFMQCLGNMKRYFLKFHFIS